ncbi:MAG: TIGR01212 family radical SAM protein [bacterium]|nr:TIGR01212 family radical SAM protein [bacterium]
MIRYSRYLKSKFGEPVCKIPLNGRFTCPNIDGSKGTGGCIYCDNNSFSLVAGSREEVLTQLERGISRSPRRYNKYIGYFQPYSNTYGNVEKLKTLFEPVIDYPGVVGLAIGTRPDCFDDDIYDYLEELKGKTYLGVELGVQSVHDGTLELVNRCQSHEDCVQSVTELHKRGIETVAHVILGLPGETPEMMEETARTLAGLPFHGVKVHQLMIIRGTEMEKWYEDGKVEVLNLEQYVELVHRFTGLLRPDQVIHRLAADCTFENGLVAPEWSAQKAMALSAINAVIDRPKFTKPQSTI